MSEQVTELKICPIALRVNAMKSVCMYIGLMWMVFIVSTYVDLDHGIIPRDVNSLYGILCAPFLHSGQQHIINNTIGLGIFGCIYVVLEGEEIHFPFWYIAVVSGLGTWMFARIGMHIGASGVIFGLYGYLIFTGYITRKILHVIVSIGILVTYGYLIFGAFPTTARMSWEGHLSGLIAGMSLVKLKLLKRGWKNNGTSTTATT